MNPQSGSRNAVYEETRSLLDWGFEAAPRAAAVGMLPVMAPGDSGDEPQRVAHRSQPVTPLHRAAVAAQTDADAHARYRWFLYAAGAVGVIALAGLGTGLWWRRRKPAGSRDGEPD